MGIIELLPLLMFLALAFLLFSGFPVAWVLGGVGLAFGLIGIAGNAGNAMRRNAVRIGGYQRPGHLIGGAFRNVRRHQRLYRHKMQFVQLNASHDGFFILWCR